MCQKHTSYEVCLKLNLCANQQCHSFKCDPSEERDPELHVTLVPFWAPAALVQASLASSWGHDAAGVTTLSSKSLQPNSL
ncbi:hypothetical protein DPMN_168434 [Dreissena polymorpha]|uniref:Uncharacterized protein n=1 Tax=Dreissena polymorpha TaxID=45954 RepID=A0A9D4IZL2_DREPO|nr:hypothetical protein DPMN_168434 [Dreissena polymorpha]